MSLWGWGKYYTLIDRTTRGREKIDLVPSLFRGRVQSACSKYSQKEANLEIQVENARFSFPVLQR